MAHAVAVDCPGLLGVGFGLVHGRVGGGIDDQLRLEAGNSRTDRQYVADIQLGRAQADDLEAFRGPLQQFVAHLSPGSGDQYAHAQASLPNSWRRLGLHWSLADSCGCATGQGMFTSGSFQIKPPSSSGK